MMLFLKSIFLIAFTCIISPGLSLYRPNHLKCTFNNKQFGQPIMKTFHTTIRSNPISYIFSPDIYPIFEEAVLFNTVQALILTVVKQKSLTTKGLVHATILGIGLWTFLGFRGWIVCVTYLILGSLATKVKMNEKEV